MNRARWTRARLGPAVLAVLATLAAGGCATFSADGGFEPVATTARERLGLDVYRAASDDELGALARRVEALLQEPLSADGAVQIALLNNRGLQAAFAELAIAEAERVRAGRLPNPHLSLLRASRLEAGIREYKIEQALVFNLFSLVTMPMAVAIEQRRFEQAQRAVAHEVLRLAAETRKAYYTAVAAHETVRYMRQVRQAADAGAELARRMASVGNFSRLRQAREQGYYADAALAAARAEQSAVAARERLTRLLGLWGAQAAFRLPERLPDLPHEPRELPDVESVAVAQRLDLQAIRLETEALARNLGLARATRFLNVFELGPARVLEGQRIDGYKRGYEVAFELPLFDGGGARVARAEAVYLRALHLAAEAAINARSEVREAFLVYRTSFDIARHYRDEIVPVRRRVSEENLLRYNGMLIGVFDLLADARAQIAGVASSIEALRDFWIAAADLDMALIGRPALVAPRAAALAAAADAKPH